MSTAGIQSFNIRLVGYVQSITPWFCPQRREQELIDQTAEWLDVELLPYPHRAREVEQLRYMHSENTFTDQIILSALDRLSAMRAAVSIATEQLSDFELASLNLVAQLDQEPRNKPWYSKVSHLFTEAGGTRMHAVTKNALASVVSRRLG